jgi:hypothetical protein
MRHRLTPGGIAAPEKDIARSLEPQTPQPAVLVHKVVLDGNIIKNGNLFRIPEGVEDDVNLLNVFWHFGLHHRLAGSLDKLVSGRGCGKQILNEIPPKNPQPDARDGLSEGD